MVCRRGSRGRPDLAGPPPPQRRWRYSFLCAYDGLATLFLDRGDDARAEEYMARAQQVCEGAGVEPDSLAVMPFLG